MAENIIAFKRGAFADLPSTRDQDTFYLTSDTHQMYLGANEYTKGAKILNAEPTSSTVGEIGVLYAYNGNLYLCSAFDGTDYTYVRVANVNDLAEGVTSVAAGDGLETDITGGAAISSTGTISHSIPSGATVVADATADATPAFGGTFAIQGVATDKFGHVTASTTHAITLPTETAVTVESTATADQTLTSGGTFAAIVGVDVGSVDQSVKATSTTFTLPTDTTYSFAASASTDGGITVTPSNDSSYDVVPKGWDELAKKTDITSVFKFKGNKATVAQLPNDATVKVGDVWYVEENKTEYVCTAEATAGPPATDVVWEAFGPEVDLSAYALSADVIQRLQMSGATPAVAGNVPKIKSDGTLEDTGFTLGCSVPSTAVFTDTTYAVATTADDGLMSAADKIKLDGIEAGGQENVIESITVAGTAIAPDADKDVAIDLSSFDITVTAADINGVTNKLDLTDGGEVAGATTFTNTIHGSIDGNAATADSATTAASASTATADGAGNVITTTYATKTELTTAISWQTF